MAEECLAYTTKHRQEQASAAITGAVAAAAPASAAAAAAWVAGSASAPMRNSLLSHICGFCSAEVLLLIGSCGAHLHPLDKAVKQRVAAALISQLALGVDGF
jgi:hypothetical protein